MTDFMQKVMAYFLLYYGGVIFGCLMMASTEKGHTFKKRVAILIFGLSFSLIFVFFGIIFARG